MTQDYTDLIERLGVEANNEREHAQEQDFWHEDILLEAAEALTTLISQRDELVEALRQVEELTQRRQLPLTHQINDIATTALKPHTPEANDG